MKTELVPFIPESAPFTAEQRAYLNGFLAGLFSNAPVAEVGIPASRGRPLEPLTILFGSQTGNAEALAKKVAAAAGNRGFAPIVHDMAQYPPNNLLQEKLLLVITSTFGNGEPPDNARAFWEFLNGGQAPKLEGSKFSVLALGDTHYEAFCQCGKNFDRRLEELGAERIHPRIDCDVDYDEPFQKWLDGVLAALDAVAAAGALSSRESLRIQSTTAPSGTSYSRKNPFPGRLVTNRKLNAPGSDKDTRHIEISLVGSGLTYEVGDALGVVPTNCPELVEEILKTLGFDGEEGVPTPDAGMVSLRKALLDHFEIAQIEFPPGNLPPEELVRGLKRLAPRYYSIASSPKAHPDQVHLTVSVVRYTREGRLRKGVASTFLAERVHDGAAVPVFVHPNKNFRPPADGDTAMIMIGPGTGIAPFRAFLQERRAVGDRGKNWLFFGDQHAATDFLYREELESMLAEGALARLDTAFSRDQAQKIYVQQRLLENAAELFAWLEEGAHLHVCGDASRMAKDVDEALHQVIQQASQCTSAQAAEYVKTLQAGKRYQRDVY